MDTTITVLRVVRNLLWIATIGGITVFGCSSLAWGFTPFLYDHSACHYCPSHDPIAEALMWGMGIIGALPMILCTIPLISLTIMGSIWGIYLPPRNLLLNVMMLLGGLILILGLCGIGSVSVPIALGLLSRQEPYGDPNWLYNTAYDLTAALAHLMLLFAIASGATTLFVNLGLNFLNLSAGQ